MDAVYPFIPVKGADHEIRYSIRSLEKYADIQRVWLVGHHPDFLQCGHIPFMDRDPTDNAALKIVNVHRKIRAACRHPEVSDPFLLMNDDFILAEPLAPVHFTFGTIREHWRRRRYTDSYYSDALRRTAKQLGNVPNFETHTPMVIYKDRFLQVAELVPPILFRTAYGTIEDRVPVWDMGEDVKHYQNLSADIFRRFIEGRPFFSLSPGFRMFGYLGELYPEPSKWEN